MPIFFLMIIYFSERLINLQQVITNLQPDIIMARIEKVEIHFYILITELYSLWMLYGAWFRNLNFLTIPDII